MRPTHLTILDNHFDQSIVRQSQFVTKYQNIVSDASLFNGSNRPFFDGTYHYPFISPAPVKDIYSYR